MARHATHSYREQDIELKACSEAILSEMVPKLPGDRAEATRRQDRALLSHGRQSTASHGNEAHSRDAVHDEDGLAAMLDGHSAQGKERESDVLGPQSSATVQGSPAQPELIVNTSYRTPQEHASSDTERKLSNDDEPFKGHHLAELFRHDLDAPAEAAVAQQLTGVFMVDEMGLDGKVQQTHNFTLLDDILTEPARKFHTADCPADHLGHRGPQRLVTKYRCGQVSSSVKSKVFQPVLKCASRQWRSDAVCRDHRRQPNLHIYLQHKHIELQLFTA